MRRPGVVALVAMLCAAGTAIAQTPPSTGHASRQAQRQQWQQKWKEERIKMEQRRMERLAVLLDMTPAQRQQVQAIFTGERNRMREAMKQALAARHAAHAETLTKLGQVLSPTQMKKLKLLMPQRHRRLFMMRRWMGTRGPMGPWQTQPEMSPPPPPGAAPQ